MSEASRFVIFVNGDPPNFEAIRAILLPGDVLIAADGGLSHMQQLGLRPFQIIGDLDSAAPEDIAQMQKEGIQVIRYPREKNETDLELAMRQATASGAKQILIVGALGGRLDQTLGNIFLLSDPDLLGIDVRLENGNEEVFLIRSQAMISGQPGDIVSLLPIEGLAQGVETQGLEYPLRSETLYPFRTRGISNVMTTQQAQVSLASGLLVCIHTRGSK